MTRKWQDRRHFGEVKLKINPLPRGTGNSLSAKLRNEEIPDIFIPAIEAGVMESLESGVLMGYPVVDVEVVLIGGSFKESVGSDLAFRVSASMACKTALSEWWLLSSRSDYDGGTVCSRSLYGGCHW